MLEVKTIDANTNDQFVLASNYAHYQKTSMYAQFLQFTHKATIEYLGFYDQQQLKATAMVLIRRWLGVFSYAYIPSGICVDYSDATLLKQTHQALAQLASVRSWFLLRIDPNVQRKEKDIKGNDIKDGFNNEWVTNTLENLNYQHKGYGYGYDGSWRDRFTLVLDLNPPLEQLINNFARDKRNFYRRQLKMGITTVVDQKQGVEYLAEFEKQLTKEHGFKPKPVSYFKKLCEFYGEHAHVFVTSMSQQYNIDLINHELESGKYNKDEKAKQSKLETLEQLKQSLEKHGDTIVLSVGMFVDYGHSAWDLYSYKNPDFLNHRGTIHMHVSAMEHFKNRNITHYDFVGFSGATHHEDPYYGLYHFKSGFNPTYVEYIGQFDLKNNETLTNLFIKVSTLKVRIRRKLNALRYTKD